MDVRVESNSRLVLDAAVRRHVLRGSGLPHCLVHVLLDDGPTLDDGPSDVTWQFATAHEATIRARGLRASVDLNAGHAHVTLTPAFLARHGVFQRCVLEGIPFSLLTRRDRYPVHASAIRSGDAGILLRGASGVGKSTLVYAAHHAGHAVLADDACRVQMDPELRVWGDTPTPRVHLLDTARRDFPELADCDPSWMAAGGIVKIEINVPVRADDVPFVRRARVCLLSRSDGAVVLRDASPREIEESLRESPESQLDLNHASRDRVAALLAEPGGWHLTLSSDPREALPLLERMLASI